MTPLALYLKQVGYQVSGSDIADFRMRKKLESNGIKVSLFQKAENCIKADMLIYSTAIPKNNPEIAYALENNIPVLNRLEALKFFLKEKKIIAVTGSYGKSTTTAFTASFLKFSGINPSWLIGADLFSFSPAESNDSDWMVLESDESKPVFLDFNPYSVLITNIGKDHLPHYNNSQESLADTISQFMKRKHKDGKIYFNIDDPFTECFIKDLERKEYILCGKQNKADYFFQVDSIQYQNRKIKTIFKLTCPNRMIYTCEIPMLGENNVLDAVMAFSIACDLSKDTDQCLKGFSQLPVLDRRFEICSDNGISIVIDDEGDSPAVIQNVFENAKKIFPDKKIIAVLQPHRFSRLQNLFTEYVDSMFQGPDDIIILPVYSAGEEAIPGIQSEKLMNSIIEAGFNPLKIRTLSLQDSILYLQSYTQQPYLIITLGPGDVWKIADAYRK